MDAQGGCNLVLNPLTLPLTDLGVCPVPCLLCEPCTEGGQEHPVTPTGAGGHLEW